MLLEIGLLYFRIDIDLRLWDRHIDILGGAVLDQIQIVVADIEFSPLCLRYRFVHVDCTKIASIYRSIEFFQCQSPSHQVCSSESLECELDTPFSSEIPSSPLHGSLPSGSIGCIPETVRCLSAGVPPSGRRSPNSWRVRRRADCISRRNPPTGSAAGTSVNGCPD